MAIKIKNLRINPYTAKDTLKVIFGDEMHLTFEIPHVDGESYLCALDCDRILYPINRPVCAYTEVFTRDGDNVSFTLNLTTSKLRDYVSSIKKPMPVWLQIVREVNGKYETVLLDDILAIPSVIDGSMTVYEGDSFKELLDAKMNVPEAEGAAGQVLTMDADGHYSWQDLPEQEQADWDESDSSNVSFIKNKPQLATVATSGSYNDLTDKPVIPEQEQADWDESDSEKASYIKNKPNIPTVNDGKITVNQGGVKKGEFTVNQAGDTTIDLNDGAQSDWDESDSSNVSFIKNKPALATVATSGSYNDLTDKPIVTQPVNADWDESDSENLAYIFNKPNLATVATSGSYNDLSDKPEIPEQEQADWDESDSSAVDYIKNKPTIPAAQVQADYAQNDNTQIDYIKNKPEIIDATDYLCFTPVSRSAQNMTVTLNAVGNAPSINLEYSKDRRTWTSYTVGTAISLSWIAVNKFESVWFRGDNLAMATGWNVCHTFALEGATFAVTGNIMSLLKKDCKQDTVPFYGFAFLFNGCANLVSAPKLPASIVGSYGYARMFQGCTSLEETPELPAIGLAQYCYGGMFNGCASLKKAHDLPATNTENVCYGGMFQNCTSLKEAPVINANMYSSCSEYMFDGCTSLNHVKVNFTGFNGATEYWLQNVAASGVFECPSALDISSRGASTVPAGWTIVRTDAPQSDWNQTDSTEASFIKNKPTIPAAQIQSDWDESDSSDVSFIKNKPAIQTQYDWLCLTANEANSTVYIYKNTNDFELEYSTDGATWSAYTWEGTTGQTITLANAGDKVYWRGDNADTCNGGISNLYVQFHMSGSIKATGNVMSLLSKTCSKTEIPQFCFYQLFRGCSALTSANIFGEVKVLSGCGRIFQQCTSLTSIEIPTEVIVDHMDMMASAFNGCSSLSRVKVGFHTWFSGTVWLKNVAATGTLICPSDLDCSTRTTSRVPDGWTVERTSSPQADWDESDSSDPAYILNKPTIPAAQVQADWDESDSSVLSFIANKGVATAVSVSDSTYTLNAGTTVPVVAVASALTLSANALTAGKVGYAEIVLDLAQGASVTAGSGLTLVDTLTAGKRNVCVARWQDGVCKLYVVITEDLPVDESSSN